MAFLDETSLGLSTEQLDLRLTRIDPAQVDAVGGCLIASGLTVMVPVRGPFRRGDRSSSVEILLSRKSLEDFAADNNFEDIVAVDDAVRRLVE